MKNWITGAKVISVCLILFLLPVSRCLAQDNPAIIDSPEMRHKAAAEAETSALLEVLITHAQKENYTAFARHLVYDGSDPLRKLTTLVNYDSPFERLDAEHAANKIAESLKNSQMHNLSGFQLMKWSERELGVWNLDVTKKNGKIKTYKLTFLQIKGKFEYVRME